MKRVKLLFSEGKIELHMEEQNGTEWIDYSELKNKVCAYFNLPTDISVLELDFEAEELYYELEETGTKTVMQGLANREREVFQMLGYEYADMSNVADIVDAFTAGQISEQSFHTLLEIEGLQNDENPAIAAFLELLGGNSGN